MRRLKKLLDFILFGYTIQSSKHNTQEKAIFFVVSGKGKSYKAYGVAANAEAANTMLATFKREMSAQNVI